MLEDGARYGRIVRNEKNLVEKIVEAKDCSSEELEIKEINTGIFCFKNELLFEGLKEIKNNNAQNEYYLTDLVEIFNKKGLSVNAMVVDDVDETMGVNDRVDLAKAQKWLKQHVNKKHMMNGVTLIDPDNTYIDTEVSIGVDSVIYPNVHLEGNTVIGNNVTIFPNSYLRNAVIEDGAVIDSSKVVESKLGQILLLANVSFRNNTVVASNCRIGNFVEFKNTNFGEGSKCAHLTYVGDSDVGKGVNFGCGVVTVNYDGKTNSVRQLKMGLSLEAIVT